MPNFDLVDLLKDWGSLILAFLSLVLGGGWVKSHFEARRRKSEVERQRYQVVLEGFLRPLQGILKTTHTFFTKLRDERELAQLEYHPGRLQGFFASLPDEDPRKLLWKSYIELLQAENSRAVELIDRHYGSVGDLGTDLFFKPREREGVGERAGVRLA